jgi:hypothetical protein
VEVISVTILIPLQETIIQMVHPEVEVLIQEAAVEETEIQLPAVAHPITAEVVTPVVEEAAEVQSKEIKRRLFPLT